MRLFALLLLSGCAALPWAKVETSLVDCGASDVQVGLTPQNVANVATALGSADPSSVEPQLEAIGLEVGANTLFCLVGQVVSLYESAQVKPASLATDRSGLAVIRGESYLHGWQFSGRSLVHRRTH